jgi:SSS family solute:Na+ symporter
LDSLLNAGAVSFTEDIFKPFFPVSDEKALALGRSATVMIAVAAAGGALMVPSIIRGLLVCYSIWAPAVLPALMLGLWVKRPRPLAGILSMLAGSLSALVFNAIELTRIPAILPALLIALTAYGLGHVMDRFMVNRGEL